MFNPSAMVILTTSYVHTNNTSFFNVKSYFVYTLAGFDLTTHSSSLLGGRRRRYHKTTPPGLTYNASSNTDQFFHCRTTITPFTDTALVFCWFCWFCWLEAMPQLHLFRTGLSGWRHSTKFERSLT
jgi:hypothetical protein